MSSNQGYSSIPRNDEEGGGSSSDPLLPSHTKPSWPERADGFKQFVKRNLAYIVIVFIVAVLLGIVLFSSLLPESSLLPKGHQPFTVKSGVSEITMQRGREKCEAIKNRRREKNRPDSTRAKNPRADPNQKPILLKNAVVWDGQGNVLEDVDIYIESGVIRQVEKNISLDSNKDVKVIDVAGHVVSPGLVDMHSHMGVDSWPELHATDDTNEMTQPLTPFVRTIDAFNPSDNAIRIVSSGGVTTALVLPGSGNLMGGEAFAFKLRHISTLSNEDMLVQANIDNTEDTKWRWMKMACGENPKRVYGNAGYMPSTRLGEAYLFRKQFAEAQKLMREQDDWCRAAEGTSSRFDTPFPEDLSLESLVALLRGEVLLNVHCYETHDIEAMIRHSLEFNFTISAFHHALDAYRIPDILRRARNNITVATFADHWGYKKEAFQAIPQAPKILYDAGIPVALKSDHPVLNSQHLAFEAAKSTHYGLPPQEAFKTVTSTPANAIGLGHRVGSLKVGYDADVVIWDREPLELGATPLQVFIDGVPLFEERPIEPTVKKQATAATLKKENLQSIENAKNFVLKNVGYSFLGQEPVKGPIDVVVVDGSVICSGTDCSTSVSSIQSNEPVVEYNIQGGYVLPGLVGVGSQLGLIEIQGEAGTGDGTGRPSKSKDPKDIIFAADGIKLGTRHLEEAYKGGILTAITAPMSSNVIIGVSAAFKTGADSILNDGTIISPAVALHLQIGDDVKSDSFPTISSQISFIRQLLTENLKENNHYGQAARGEIPTVIAAHNKDEIASLVILKRNHLPKAKFVIIGGTEAYLVAPHLAEADIPVILRPVLCTPSRFDSIHCLTGAPLTNGTAAHVLHSHGVKIGVGISDDGLARNLAWDAGWLAATSPAHNLEGGAITETQAIQFITSNIRDIYGLNSVSVNQANDFIVYSGNPFDVQSRIVLIHSDKGLEAL
ncbi:composite domain of metallo-dependent hydrolase [Rhizopus microsporus var. microsporus]|nr:composite domain of metallo-dependent hydrolase [Rhizopus microsporus var. microsporus]